jgi:hypothetical protein
LHLGLSVVEQLEEIAPQPAPENGELRVVIGEFGRHLDMLAEQLGASLSEADRECVSVGESFHDLAQAKNKIADVNCDEPGRTVLKHSCEQIGNSLHAAVVALQYHDRLAQQLALIRTGLTRLQELLHDQTGRSYNDWLESLRHVERLNRIEQRRLGPDPDMGQSDTAHRSAAANDSVELF